MRYNNFTGEFFVKAGELLGVGYSGHGPGVNNPADQWVRNVGPIPDGMYRITGVDAEIGPLTFHLFRTGGPETLRSGFCIHGDNRLLNHSASEGCIVLDLQSRLSVLHLYRSGAVFLEVFSPAPGQVAA